MQLGSFNTLYGTGRVIFRPTVSPLLRTLPQRSATRAFDPTPYREMLRETIKLREALRDIRHSFQTLAGRRIGKVGGVVSVASAGPLGLDPSQTFTTLKSTEEVNTIGTSYTPFGPDFNGGSTSLPTLTGIYTGPDDDVHSFEVTKGGNIGGNKKLQLKVRDQFNNLVEVINIPAGTPPDTPIELKSGLTLTLSAGKLVKNDAFQVSLFTSVGSAVDPDKPFDGSRNEHPNFEPGLNVTTGSFDVNDVTISVAANDSINTVLAKINSSGAGVNAVFNGESETIELTSTVAGSAGQIELNNDTSGFLAATKLAGAVALPGRDSDLTVPINTVVALNAIQDGQFSINGVSFSIDTSTDSLNDVLERINQSEANVSASYDASNDVLRIGAQPHTTLELDDGSAGFFSALRIEAKSYEVRRKSGRLSAVSRDSVIERLKDFAKSLNSFSSLAANPLNLMASQSLTQNLWSGIKSVVERLNEPPKDSPSELEIFGITFSLNESDELVAFDSDAVTQAISRHDRDFFEFFLEEKDGLQSEGLFDSLDSTLREREKAIFFALAEAGVRLVDIYA